VIEDKNYKSEIIIRELSVQLRTMGFVANALVDSCGVFLGSLARTISVSTEDCSGV